MTAPTKYVRSSLEIVSSEDSGYQPEKFHSKIASLLESDSEYGVFDFKYSFATGGGTVLGLGSYGEIKQMWIQNLDSANNVNIEYTSTAGSCDTDVPAGRLLMVPSVSPAGDLTGIGASAAVVCRVILVATMTEA